MAHLKYRMEGDDLLECRSVDVEPVLEQIKTMRSLGEVGSSEMRHAARVPNSVAENYCAVNGISWHELMSSEVHIKRMLNDPALSGLRIWKGRL